MTATPAAVASAIVIESAGLYPDGVEKKAMTGSPSLLDVMPGQAHVSAPGDRGPGLRVLRGDTPHVALLVLRVVGVVGQMGGLQRAVRLVQVIAGDLRHLDLLGRGAASGAAGDPHFRRVTVGPGDRRVPADRGRIEGDRLVGGGQRLPG